MTPTDPTTAGKTPHQLRIEAEQQRDAFKAAADRLYLAHYIIDPGLRAAKHREALADYAKLTEGQP